MQEDILIIGGGFAGFWAALAAKRVAGTRASVTLVSREPVLQIRPRLYEASPEALGVELIPLLRKVDVEFVESEAGTLDVERQTVELASGRRHYAKLIVATGSSMRRPKIPGATDAYSIDSQREAVLFDRRLALIASNVANPTVAIVGAGFTGIELALELRDRVAAHRDAASGERLRIVLIDRAPVVGAELGAGPRATIEAALAEARVELELAATVTALGANRVAFSDGTTLDADAVVLTTGMVASPFVAQVPGQRDGLGRVIVDQALRAPAAPNVFVTGDAAAADTGDGAGHRTLQSCQHALQLGRFAGENAARDLLGMQLLPYTQARYVTCLDLGRSGAVFTEGWQRAMVQSGRDAKALKHRINTVVIYPPTDVSGATLLELSSVDPSKQKLPAA
jgi:NADH dehydrogenase